MKIGIDISQIVYRGTGVASYTSHLVGSLLKNSQEEYVLFGSALRRQGDLLEYFKNVKSTTTFTGKIFPLPPSILSWLWNSLHVVPIEKLIGSVDVFHTSDWSEPPSGRPKVTTIHDLMVYKYPKYLPRSIIQTQKAKLAWVRKESRHIIADSQNTKNDIVTFLGIKPDQISVVYLGVGKEFFPVSIDKITAVKRKYQINGKYLLTIGTREPRKNLTRVIEAFKNLAQNDLSLVVGGNFGWGSQTDDAPSVKLLGYVDEADLPALYTGATGFVYASLYEGFGLPILEAMAAGCPVVTSDRGSLAEIKGPATIVDPENLESIADGIGKIISLSTSSRNTLIAKGIEHAGTFTWEKTAAETLAVYKSVGEK
jgi:glycosyltransferase involved in cell wall biosynthesis